MTNFNHHTHLPNVPMKSKLITHPLRWFKNRVGKEVHKVTAGTVTPIQIASEAHAKAMHNSQYDKQIKYAEI